MNNKGFALIAAIIIMVLLSALGTFLVSLLSTDTDISQDTLRSTQAFFLAEAGLQHVMYKLGDNFAYRDEPTQESGNLGEGSFSVTVIKDGAIYSLVSTGTVGAVERKIKQSVELIPEAFKYALRSDAGIDFGGCVGTVTGHISAGRRVVNYEGMTIDGTIIEGSALGFPSVDYSEYEAIANHIYNTDFTFEPGSYTGIYFCRRTVTINRDVTINGSIICLGEILLTGDNIRITRSSNNPAILAEKGINLNNLANISITGFIRSAAADIEIRGCSNVEILGTLITKKGMAIENCPSINITYDESILLDPPPYFELPLEGTGVVAQPDWHEST